MNIQLAIQLLSISLGVSLLVLSIFSLGTKGERFSGILFSSAFFAVWWAVKWIYSVIAFLGPLSIVLYIIALGFLNFISWGLSWASVSLVMEARARKKADKAYEKRLAAERQEAERRQSEAERERCRQIELTKINNHKAQQLQCHLSLNELAVGSFDLFEAMPKHLIAAESHLDQAESDFEEGAFAPFWDSIESAARELGCFHGSIQTIACNAIRHRDLSMSYEGNTPSFPINLDSVTGMTIAKTTSDRLRSIVRRAQCNFQFATIFEQRKTNHLLVAGFTNLGQALDGMGMRIESSLADLTCQISVMSSTLNESIQNVGTALNQTLTAINTSSVSAINATEKVASRVEGIHQSLQMDAANRKKRHEQVLEMLDNIQRRRKPTW